MTTDEMVSEICRRLDGLPVEVIDDAEAGLAGGPLERLARAFRAPMSVQRPDGGYRRGKIARLLISQALRDVAWSDDGAIIAQALRADSDPLWRLVGDAVEEFRQTDFCDVVRGWGISCPADEGDCVCEPEGVA